MKVIVVAAGLGVGTRVKVSDGERGNVIATLFAYDSRFSGGVNVATGDVNGDGALDIITGVGVDGDPCKSFWVGLQ